MHAKSPVLDLPAPLKLGVMDVTEIPALRSGSKADPKFKVIFCYIMS